MVSMKKILLFILTSIILNITVAALPGTTQFIPDSAGEYVYYRDTSFTRESYIGLLMYDKGTYQRVEKIYFGENHEKKNIGRHRDGNNCSPADGL